MKTLLSILLIACFPIWLFGADEMPGMDAVIVRTINATLPHDANLRAKFLWDTFANKPEEKQFSHYTTKDWKEHFERFSQSLIAKAKTENLDTNSLHRTLNLILKDSRGKIAYLPVGAYQTTLDGNLVWIITVKWEYPSQEEPIRLGHIRIFAFDQKTRKQVAFNTCM